MRETFLNTKEDVDWILSTHLKGKKIGFRPRSFIVYGNEDSPIRVTLFKKKNPGFNEYPDAVFSINDENELVKRNPISESTAHKLRKALVFINRPRKEQLKRNPRVRVHATPTEHEKNEWARMAQDAYAKGFNAIGHRFSAAAALPRGEKIPSARFDSLMADYRAWLIDGWKAFAEENPRGRSKRGITRVSQATGARPSKRLIERRKKTLKAPKGYFANPKLRKGQVFVVTNKAGDWLAEFGHRDDAVRWAKAYANRHGVQVRVVEA